MQKNIMTVNDSTLYIMKCGRKHFSKQITHEMNTDL